MPHTHALVIGSGPNGLAAAIRLAEAGHAVTVLEAADQPGGAVRTDELTLPGFHHDVFSAVHPAAAASPVFARMPLERFGLEWVQPAAAMAHPLPGGRAAVLYRDVAATAAGLDALAPGDGERWARLVTPLLEHFDAVRNTMLGGFPPIRGPWQLLTESPPTLLSLARLLVEPAQRLGGRLFRSSGARAWLYGAAMHGDAAPEQLGSGIAAVYLDLLGHAVGWPSPRGGAETLTTALAGYLRSLGGEIRTGAPAVRVHANGRGVTGVELAGGERLGGDIVIATVMPHALARLADFPGWYRRLLGRYTYGPATLKLDWALDGPIPWENDAVRGAGTVHVGGDEPEMLSAIAQSATGLPERPFLLLGQQTVADPSRAPAGRHTAWAYTHGPHHADWSTQPERVEAQVERFAPGFRDRILARHVLTPGDLQARNPNLVGGDVGGGSYRFDQVLFRPVPLPSPYRTPVRGLYIGSAAAFPGGAVHGVPGDAAARAALSSMR